MSNIKYLLFGGQGDSVEGSTSIQFNMGDFLGGTSGGWLDSIVASYYAEATTNRMVELAGSPFCIGINTSSGSSVVKQIQGDPVDEPTRSTTIMLPSATPMSFAPDLISLPSNCQFFVQFPQSFFTTTYPPVYNIRTVLTTTFVVAVRS